MRRGPTPVIAEGDVGEAVQLAISRCRGSCRAPQLRPRLVCACCALAGAVNERPRLNTRGMVRGPGPVQVVIGTLGTKLAV